MGGQIYEEKDFTARSGCNHDCLHHRRDGKCGDVNSDGKVDRKDLTRLAQYFARWDVEIGE